jgi:subtilisin family serine protease
LVFAASAAPARAELCVIVDPVVSLGGCASSTAAGEGGATAGATTADEAVRLSSTTVEYDPERIAVTVRRGASRDAVMDAFAAAGVDVEEEIPQLRAYLVRVLPDEQATAVDALRAERVIARAGPDVVGHALDTIPNDSEWPAQAGLRVVGLPRAWDVSRGSSKLVVAVLDTGVDPAQPDLKGALVAGANFVDPSAPPLDDHGHGTAVAGVIAARANNGRGMAGVCWFCLVMPVKVLGSDGSGDDARIAAGIVWAANRGARVINLSLGGPGTTPELEAAVAYAVNRGALVVAAAGNSGTSVPFYPAADINALSVAGTTTADRGYSWSNYGSWVDVAAPGCNVAPARDRGYGLFCGTSSATPIVAGLAALAFAAQPGATPAAVAGAIEHATTPLSGFVRYGRVDAPRALASLTSAVRRVSEVRRGTLTSGARSLNVAVASVPGALAVTLRLSALGTGSLAVVSADDGTVLARTAGRGPLRLQQPVLGPVRLEVRGLTGFPLRYTLAFSYGKASS